MSEFEDIQRLIRLKRFEQPEEGFTENFLQKFHQRQRAELLKQSSLDLFLERVTTWWNHLLVPKWGLVAAAVSVCTVGLWMFTRPAGNSATDVTSVPVVTEKPFIPKLDLSDLPLARMAENNDATMADMLLRKHIQVQPTLQGKVSPSLPVSGWQTPTLKNAFPATHEGAENGLGK